LYCRGSSSTAAAAFAVSSATRSNGKQPAASYMLPFMTDAWRGAVSVKSMLHLLLQDLTAASSNAQLTQCSLDAAAAGLLNAGFLMHEHGRRCLKAWPHSKVSLLCLLRRQAAMHGSAWHAAKLSMQAGVWRASEDWSTLCFAHTATACKILLQCYAANCCGLPAALCCRLVRCGRLRRQRSSRQSQQRLTSPTRFSATGSSAQVWAGFQACQTCATFV
jgi:hypothetical protein